jgi:hypothetical protein
LLELQRPLGVTAHGQVGYAAGRKHEDTARWVSRMPARPEVTAVAVLG